MSGERAHMHPPRWTARQRETAVSAPTGGAETATADGLLPAGARACTTRIRVGTPWQGRRALARLAPAHP